jgi:hypothetical protein
MADPKTDPQDDILPLPKLKQMLAIAESKPLGCAFVLTKDKKECLLLIDKRAKPKKVANMLKADAKAIMDAPSLRFGRVEIDSKNDPGTVRFTVNRSEAGGTMMTLTRLVKKAQYQVIVINASEELEEESEEETEEGSDEIKASPPPPPPLPDAAALTAKLRALMGQIAAAAAGNSTVQGNLVSLATTAAASLKAGDLMLTAVNIGALEKAIADATNNPQTAGPTTTEGDAAGTAYSKSRRAWIAVRKQVETDLDKLRAEIVKTYEADGIGPQIDKSFRDRVAPVLQTLDERLAEKLEEATSQTDPAQRTKLVGEAKQIIQEYQNFVSSSQIVTDLDTNPFAAIAIKQTVAGTLGVLAKALQ